MPTWLSLNNLSQNFFCICLQVRTGQNNNLHKIWKAEVKWWLPIRCDDGHKENHLMDVILFSFSFASHPVIFLNYWPCWGTANPGPPPDTCSRTQISYSFHSPPWLLAQFLFFQLPFRTFTFPVISHLCKTYYQKPFIPQHL